VAAGNAPLQNTWYFYGCTILGVGVNVDKQEDQELELKARAAFAVE